MSLDKPGFKHSTFNLNGEQLSSHAVARGFFDAVVAATRRVSLLPDEHFTVGGPPIET